MLSVLLTILKIIGITLLVILGLVLLILLLVLFVPFRYEISGGGCFEKGEDAPPLSYGAKVRFSWLLRFISVRAAINKEDGFGAKAKVLGIPIVRIGNAKKKKSPESGEEENKSDRKREKKKKKDKKDKKGQESPETLVVPEEAPMDPELLDIELPGDGFETEGTVVSDETLCLEEKQDDWAVGQSETLIPVSSEMPLTETESQDTEGDDAEDTEEETEEEKESFSEKFYGFLLKLPEKVQSIVSKILKKAEGIKEKAAQIKHKLDAGTGFLEHEDTQAFLVYALGEVKKLLKHVLPRKVRVNAEIGFDDPSLTGKLLVVLSLLYPFAGPSINITPVFESRLCVKGDLYIKGHIRLISIVVIGLKVLLSRKFKRLRRQLKILKAEI